MIIKSAEQGGGKDAVFDPKYKQVVVAFNSCAEAVEIPCPVSGDVLLVHPDLADIQHVAGARAEASHLTLPARTFCTFVETR
jgi:hypothetical protein